MASKSKSRRRVFRASCILAALIVAGSSFAWFTSKDEVTNRLSASGDYDVTIAEDFTPPEKWLPGQKVDKNVGAVNTGTIDAFVRMWLEGEMKVLNEKRDTQKFNESSKNFTDGTNVTLTAADTVTAEGVIGSNVTRETDEDLIAKNLTYYYTPTSSTPSIYDKVSLKELDNTNLYNNPNSPITTVSSPDGYTEVMALQAGGELAYVKTDDGTFKFTFKPNQTSTIVSAGYTKADSTKVGGTRYDILGGEEYTVSVGDPAVTVANTDDIVVDNASTPKTIKVDTLDNFYKYLGGNIDTNTFEPCTTGLYIFKRNSDLKTDTYEDSEYTGYYYVKKAGDGDDADKGAEGKFFALQYENDGTSTRSDYVLDKDTYSITRDAAGNVTFVPYRKNGTYQIGAADPVNAVKVDTSSYYDATTGAALTGGTWTPGDGTADKSVTLYTAKTNVIENNELKWTYNDNIATPSGGETIKIGDTTYTYSQTDNKWKKDNAIADNQDAINAAYAKLGLEVEDNGVVYTYDAEHSTWKAADNSTVTPEINARLNAAVTKKATLTATYYGAENAAVLAGSSVNDTSDDISVIVNLTNINAAEAEAWTAITASGNNRDTATDADDWGVAGSDKVTFYYNNDVEEGASTRKLVDSVELSKGTQKNAYLGFDFDLNVNMNSIQITIDDNGKEAFETVNNPAWAGAIGEATPATGAHTADPAQNGTEIDQIKWDEYHTT